MTPPKPSGSPSSQPDDPFDDLYQQYEDATEEVKGQYQRLGTAGRYTPAAKPTTPPKEQAAGGLEEALFQLVEAVWELTHALRTEQESEDGDND